MQSSDVSVIDLAQAADFRLGSAVVRPRSLEVVARDGGEMLEKRVMQVLVALARRPGEVVTRDELFAACWVGRIVSDDSLHRCILRLRRLAGDGDDFSIETIRGVGYRLNRSAAAKASPDDTAEASIEEPSILPQGSVVHGLAPPSRPSIAVMPFANLSSDRDQDHFVDGMVEEIVGSLSQFRSIFVISAGSSLTFKGQAITACEAARRLGVRYVLEGSVRKSGDRVRISVNLIDGADGEQVWANRWDDTLDDVFALQDKVALCVAGVIEPAIQHTNMQRVAARPAVTMDSYDLYLRGLALFWAFRRDETFRAIELLTQSSTLDPQFGLAFSLAAACHRQVVDQGWSEDPDRHRREGLALAEEALRVGGDDAKVLAQVANSLPGLEGNVRRAVTLVERAGSLNPGSAFVAMISGVVQLRNGAPDVAAEHLEKSIRLDPLSGDNGISRMYLALARVEQGRFDDALALFETTPFRIPASYALLAALHGHLGRADAAREQLALFRASTAISIDDVVKVWAPREDHRQICLDGLALALRDDDEAPRPGA